MYVGHRLLRTKFLPLFVQRRCPARPHKVWGHGTVSRSDGLCKIQGSVWRKPGAVRTLRSASFKHKNNALRLSCQQPKTNFGRLNNYIRFYLWKRKIPPMQRSDGFCRVNRRQNRSGVLRGGMLFLGNHPLKVVVIMMSTTTFVSRIWSKGYHGSVSASIWFWKIYYGKSIGVRLLAVKHYSGRENNAWAMDTSAKKVVEYLNKNDRKIQLDRNEGLYWDVRTTQNKQNKKSN